jgi:hypothetical protein
MPIAIVGCSFLAAVGLLLLAAGVYGKHMKRRAKRREEQLRRHVRGLEGADLERAIQE